MRVFLTGATGFVGSVIVRELIDSGHQVLGLVRSDQGAAQLRAAGAGVHRGSLEDVETLKTGAAGADAVIHTAFVHDFSNYESSAELDRRAIEVLGAVLAGSDRQLIVTSGTAVARARGAQCTEEDGWNSQVPRRSEQAAAAVAERGVRVSVVRLPPSVHGDGDHAFVPALIGIARQKQVSAYIGDGLNRWPAVHRLDAARLFRLALERGDARVYHAVADEGVPTRDIAEVIARRLNVPTASKSHEEAAGHFGWLGYFFAMDNPTSSAITRQVLGWQPTQAGLIADIDRPSYFD